MHARRISYRRFPILSDRWDPTTTLEGICPPSVQFRDGKPSRASTKWQPLSTSPVPELFGVMAFRELEAFEGTVKYDYPHFQI